jgi:branched-chain amino acid transport system substrate-binding protein
MRVWKPSLVAAGAMIAAATMAQTPARAGEITIGYLCDRTGPTQTVGTFLCPGFHDYINLLNSKGGVEGHTIRVMEVDNEYKVPPSMEAYQLFKKEGAILVSLYGTPITQALTANLNDDKIPGTSPGFGTAAAANGLKYPYLFPMAASYWSQAGAAVEFAKGQMGGLKGKKIAYMYYDNPAGREPLPVLEKLAQTEGYDLKTFAVPPPGVEMKVQVQDLARRYRADFVITHLFGKGPSVSIKEIARMGFPLNKVVSLVWGAGEADVMGAGGWDKAQGYNGLQFAGVGNNYPVHDEIRAMYKAQGKEPPAAMESTVFYNRGVLQGAVYEAAIRNAIKAKGGSADITGEDVRKGFEDIADLSLGGLVPPLKFTAEDHEGGGWVRVFRVEGDGFKPATDWIKGYRDTVMEMVRAH